jgi:Bacterial Ig-like domain/Bacterial Ig domain
MLVTMLVAVPAAGAAPFVFAPAFDGAVTIDSGPQGVTNDPAPQFTFSSTQTTTGFRCTLATPSQPGTPGTCTSPYAVVETGDGDYTFTVEGLGADDQIVGSASRTFTVDTQAPNPPSIAAPTPGSLLATSGVDVSGSAEAGTHVVVFDGDAPAAATDAAGDGSWSVALSGLTDGGHSLTAMATDPAGNVSLHSDTVSVTVDTTAPETTIDSHNTGGATADFTFSSSESGSTFECSLNMVGAPPGGFPACSSPQHYDGLADGDYEFAVRATDPAGNVDGTPAVFDFTIDSTPPAAPAITSPDDNSVQNSTTVTISGTAENGATVEVFDGTTSKGLVTVSDGRWSLAVTGVADGTHTYTAKATDAAGNTSGASNARTVTIDTAAPDTTITGGPSGPTNSAVPTFTFAGGARFECRLDGPGTTTGSYGACSSPVQYSKLADGTYTFSVYAVDAAGNQDPSPAQRTFAVDTATPAPPAITAPAEGATQSATTVALAGSAEPGATVEVFEGTSSKGTATASDSGAWSLAVSGAALGSHTYSATATDAAGNVSGPSNARTVRIAAPDATIESGTADGAAASFAFGSSASDVSFECRLDGPSGPGTYSACVSPKAYDGLAPGDYTFLVRAVDPSGADASAPSARTFSVTAVAAATPTPTPTPTPSPTTTPTPPPPAPEYHQTVVIKPISGTIRVRKPGTNEFVDLDVTQGIPLGSTIDAKHGRIQLASEPKNGGEPQKALFYGGLFKVEQPGGVIELTLNEPLAPCATAGKASAAAKKPKTRKLWGDGSGSFRTKGQYSAATVRGTKWLVQDSCAGTLTEVAHGVVSVTDSVRHKTILLRGGKRYLARPTHR